MISALVLTAAGTLLNPAPATAAGPGRTASHQDLAWTPCEGIANPRLRCTLIRVPLDHTRPHGRLITIAVSRLAATEPAQRRGVLFTTGGGPGGPGVPLPDELSRSLDPAVLARYDLIGFDLRFVERSSPISCGHPAEEPGGWWSRTDGYQPFPQVAAEAARYARDCAAAAGPLLAHATTANAARDMDLIRQALGEPRISYLGGSYAAMLGSVYASMFPGRVDRFVLDSPPDYRTVWHQFDLDRTAAMERNLAAFTDWLAANDATYHLGTTAAEVSTRWIALSERALASPIVAGDHAWTFDEIGFLVVSAIFFEQYWSYYAPVLAAVAAGTAPPYMVDLRPLPLPGTTGVPADNHTALSTAFRCADGAWPREMDTYRRDLAAYTAKYPVFGASNANIGPCAFWPTRTGVDRVRLGTDRAPGALVLAATNDASVPLVNSRAVTRALAGSRLVTVDLRTHVPFLGGTANACMTAAVTEYLAAGTLPPADVSC